MSLLLNIGMFVFVAVLVGTVLRSVSHVAVVNRRSADRLARYVGRFVYATLEYRFRFLVNYSDRQDVLAWALPIYVFLLTLVRFGLVQVGFALCIWALRAQPTLLRATIASGSALSTLGFLTPPAVAGQMLAILEGAMGLGIIVFYFTFIPGFQNTISFRQSKVAWL